MSAQPEFQPQPQPQARRKSWFARHKFLTAVGAIVAIGVVAAALNGGGTDEPAAGGSAGTPAATTAAAAPGLGTPVRDGKFEFVVTQVEPGVTRVGSDLLGADAQGQFVLVHMDVTNIGNEAQYFAGSNQKLVDDQGREHSASDSASIYLENNQTLFNQINPGNTVSGIVVFDVPSDAVPTTLELHDSMFSGGVKVALG